MSRSLLVPGQLGIPPSCVRLGPGAVIGAGVPEAAVNENSNPLPWKQKICSATQAGQNLAINEVSEPS